MHKRQSRLRRARRTREHIKRLGVPCLTVHRSGQHLYAQVIEPKEGKVLVAANSLQKDVLKSGSTKNKEAATAVGKAVGERALKAGVKKVAFDRSGFKYHGRIKALADAAREAGLEF